MQAQQGPPPTLRRIRTPRPRVSLDAVSHASPSPPFACLTRGLAEQAHLATLRSPLSPRAQRSLRHLPITPRGVDSPLSRSSDVSIGDCERVYTAYSSSHCGELLAWEDEVAAGTERFESLVVALAEDSPLSLANTQCPFAQSAECVAPQRDAAYCAQVVLSAFASSANVLTWGAPHRRVPRRVDAWAASPPLALPSTAQLSGGAATAVIGAERAAACACMAPDAARARFMDVPMRFWRVNHALHQLLHDRAKCCGVYTYSGKSNVALPSIPEHAETEGLIFACAAQRGLPRFLNVEPTKRSGWQKVCDAAGCCDPVGRLLAAWDRPWRAQKLFGIEQRQRAHDDAASTSGVVQM